MNSDSVCCIKMKQLAVLEYYWGCEAPPDKQNYVMVLRCYDVVKTINKNVGKVFVY